MKKFSKALVATATTSILVLVIWAIVGGEDNIARQVLSFIGAVVFSVVGLTASLVVRYYYIKGGGIPL